MPSDAPIYLDHHATTPCDPRVVQAMLPYFTEHFGNPGSVSHTFGAQAREAVEVAREQIARGLNAQPREIVFTSGATESNNLALRGVAERPRRRGNRLLSVTTEHRAVLDPLARLASRGFDVKLLEVTQSPDPRAGWLAPGRVAEALDDETLLVSVMLANNEIGVVQDLAAITQLCHAQDVLVHCDATQAVGKLPVDVLALGVDMLSFTAHKIYGPKGVGALYVRRTAPPVRLVAQLDGGGQEAGFRSGTLNVPGIVGLARALDLCLAELPTEAPRQMRLRDRLFAGLTAALDGVRLNGPALDEWLAPGVLLRLPGNLNVTFAGVDGEALMLAMQSVAVSSGSACTSANPEPSHVLRAIGLSDDGTQASLRFGLGRSTTEAEIDRAVAAVAAAVVRLRKLGAGA